MNDGSTATAAAALAAVIGAHLVQSHDAISDDVTHDESLGSTPVHPVAVVTPETAQHVADVLAWCTAKGVPVTARGSGSGLSGACVPCDGGIVVSFERMAGIVEIDVENHIAVVQPGVRLDQLDAALAEHGLWYPVRPGEYSASLGGNVATNAGGMTAVRYGVTRHHVLGLEIVLPTGEVMRTGGRIVKASSGYDLTQLVIGSEGTLALVTEATLKLQPRPSQAMTVLAPFATLDEVTRAVPRVVTSGVAPSILEYIDLLTMAAIRSTHGLDLGVPEDIQSTALAYLVIRLEGEDADRLEGDMGQVAELLSTLGALDVYVLPPGAAASLVEAREKAFWMAKASNADDIVDIAVPRGAIPALMEKASALGQQYASWIAGCGHAGDGNVHLAVFQPDATVRKQLMMELFTAAVEMGGVVSGEHGIGLEKKPYFLALEDPAKVALMRRIKQAFDPAGILNPGKIFDPA